MTSTVPPPPPAPVRPWQANALTALMALSTLGNVLVLTELVDPVTVIRVLLSVLTTIGLAKRSNLAWGFSIVAAGLSLLAGLADPLVLIVSGAMLAAALAPATRAWYRRGDARSNTSVSKGFIIGVVVVLALALGLMAVAFYA